MKLKNTLLKYLTIAGFFLFPITNSVPKNNDFFSRLVYDKLAKVELIPPPKKVIKHYKSPFIDIKGNTLSIEEWTEKTDKLGYEIISTEYRNKINKDAQSLIEKVVDSAFMEYQYERDVRAEHKELCGLILEYLLRKNENWANQKDSLVLKRGRTKGTSYFVPGKKLYSPEDPDFKEEEIEFQKKLRWFGSYLANPKKKKYYNKKRARELRGFGLKPTDCITYVLKSFSKASGKNYLLRSCSNATGLSKKLKDFEGIYIAQNTIKTDSVMSGMT